MKLSDILLLAAGGLLGLFGLIILVGSALGPSDEFGQLGNLLMTLIFGLGPLALAGVIGWWVWRRVSRRRRESLERLVLGLGAGHAGRLTPMLLAQGSDLTLAEAKEVLDDMHRSSHCRLEVDTEGAVVYCFGPIGQEPPPLPAPASS